MSCIRVDGPHEERGEGCGDMDYPNYPPPPPVTLVDGRGTVNGLTATSVGEAVPPDSPCRTPLKPALGHIDFWPSCQTRALQACDAIFETFDILVERANRWMQQFPDFELINCETVDKKVKMVQDIYSASMCYRDEEHTRPVAIHIKGLRLWYHQRRNKSCQPFTIDYMDFVPRYLNPGEKHPKFDTLTDILDRINTRLKQYPLQGSIINVESVNIKIPEQEWSYQFELDSSICQCLDAYFTHQIYFVRVLYKVGQPTFEVVGIKDFLPDTLNEGSIFHRAEYSPLTSLIERARVWINQSRGIRVTNIQTLETKHRKKSENQGHRFNTERMFEYKIEDRFRAYFLRVGYVKPTDTALCLASYPPPELACRTFVPFIKIGTEYENITELQERAETCINLTGANPIFVETVAIPEWMTRQEYSESGDRTFFDGEWFFVSDKDGNPKGPYRHSLCYAIRIYFDGDFEDPAFMRDDQVQPPDESCCAVM